MRHPGQRVTYGEPDASQLGPESVITITRSERLSLFRLLVAAFLNETIMRQMVKRDTVIYAELEADVRAGWAQTLSVWKNGREMTEFRNSGAHGRALRFFRWVFYGGKVQAYVLSYKAWGEIPNMEEAAALAVEYGRFADGGEIVRQAKNLTTDAKKNNGSAGA
ncbi:hypothetical protein EL26_02270 [Tumebacillus flagellatus]|uniref:Uncharacterized protein n=1 Tax=Tumebacillus flagellatus TaxID=1157490 RepID=A0A074LW90_9BACL|nr:hypothetical protein EL26_02270 [Tumebacillus flagellatus]